MLIICFLFYAIPCFAQLQVYVIYDKATGEIIETANVNLKRDQEWIAQGDMSTTYGSILKKLKNDTLAVKYFKKQKLPNKTEQKINIISTKIVDKSQQEIDEDAKNKLIAEKQAKIKKLNEILEAQAKKAKLQEEINALHVQIP